MAYKDKLCTNFIVRSRETLPYGNKDRGKFVPQEKGRRAIFVPSWGVLDKEEVDYIVEAEQEKEDERIRKNQKSPTKERLEQLVEATRRAPSGQRAKTAQQIIDGG